ncbi:hypothetical protein ACLOJK_022744, partial [Asimina triloba]
VLLLMASVLNKPMTQSVVEGMFHTSSTVLDNLLIMSVKRLDASKTRVMTKEAFD